MRTILLSMLALGVLLATAASAKDIAGTPSAEDTIQLDGFAADGVQVRAEGGNAGSNCRAGCGSRCAA